VQEGNEARRGPPVPGSGSVSPREIYSVRWVYAVGAVSAPRVRWAARVTANRGEAFAVIWVLKRSLCCVVGNATRAAS